MAVVATTTYLYVNTNLTQFFVQGSELVDRGPWSSSAFYAVNDVIQIGVDQYVALQSNTNAYPTGIVDNNWSTLVIVEEQAGTSVSAGSDAYARMTAEAAYFWGTTAYVIGTDAYNLAVTGTNMVLIETGSRIAADAAIVAFVFGSLAVDLAAEAGSRIAADLTEAGTRSQEDQYLQNQIIAETGSRIAADDALIAFVFGSIAVDLSAETGSRIAADLSLTWSGTNEATSRIAGDQQIITIVETGTNTANSAWALAQLGTISPPLSTLPDVSIPAPTAQQVLTFNGSKWTAADAPSTVGAGNVTFFLDDNPSGTLTYDQLTAFPTGGPEVAETVVVTTGSGQVVFMNHLSDFLNRTRIDAGLWEFNNYVSVDTASAMLRIDILVRDISGTETFLFTANTDQFNSVTPFLDAVISSQGSYLINTTDKLLARFYGSTTSTSPVTVSVYHQGSEHQSHFHTPLVLSHNDLAGLQGGSTNQFYHLAQNEFDAVRNTSDYPSASNPLVTQSEMNVVGSLAQAAYDLASSSPAFPDVGNRLVSGGNAVWITGYTFRVQPTIVDFNGTTVNFPQTDITLPPSDPVDDRLDIIVADKTYGSIVAISGTVSTPPTFPDYDALNQFQLTFIPVDNATTAPDGVSQTWIYRENLEWTFTGSPTINPNSPSFPYQGAKCIEGTTVINNQFFYLQAPLAFTAASYDLLYLYIRPKAGWTSQYLRLNWETSGGARRGNYVNLSNGSFGFNTASLGYQLIAIPISLFGLTSTTAVQRVRATLISSVGALPGFYIDDIGLQIGVSAPPVAVPDATTTTKGIVLLAPDYGSLVNTVVQGNDTRLALAAAEPGLRTTAIVVEQGTRAQEDQNLQNQIGVIQSILGQSFAGTLALYTAQVLYAKPDTAFTIVNGVITGRSDLYYSWEDFEYYGTTAGTTPLLAFDKSTSWGDVGIVYTNNLDIGVNGTDSMNLYSVGTMTQTSDSGGTGWTSAGSIYQQDYWYAFLGTETFDYAVGTLSSSGSEMTGGAGWIGSAVVYSGSNRP